MHIPRPLTILALLPLVLGGLATMPSRPASQGKACFRETGHDY